MNKVLILDTHPTSYRSNLYKYLGEDLNENLLICYLSGYSLNTHIDIDFNSKINDTNVVTDNYKFEILSKNRKPKKVGFSIFYFIKALKIIKKFQPEIIIFTSLSYPIFVILAFFIHFSKQKIKLALRTETEDSSRKRSKLKSFFRNIIFKIIYYPIKVFMPIGSRSTNHFLRFYNYNKEIIEIPYISAPTVSKQSQSFTREIRQKKRNLLNINDKTKVISFAGKLISKKNVDFIIKSLTYTFSNNSENPNIFLLIIGEGIEKNYLKKLCKIMKSITGINYHFTGFVEPDKLYEYYLASDIFVLPSKQSGETWGIVCNEALECGCSLIISKYAGCSNDFVNFERVEIIDVNNFITFSQALRKLSKFEWDANWCEEVISGKYSMESVSKKLANYINDI